MFVKAIETAAAFTRPIHTIIRTFGSKTPVPGAATLFFVNSDGWALTCAHVARQVGVADQVMLNYQAYRAEVAALPKNNKHGQRLRDLERKYSYAKDVAIEIRNTFVVRSHFHEGSRSVPHLLSRVVLKSERSLPREEIGTVR